MFLCALLIPGKQCAAYAEREQRGKDLRNLNRIAFFWVGEILVPTLLVTSIRHALGQEIEIVQLSDRSTARVEGVTACKNMRLSPDMMVARLEAYSSLEIKQPTLFLDADMLVLRNFDLPALSENEIGVTLRKERDNASFAEGSREWRDFPEFRGKMAVDVMPYVYSFVYTRSEVLFIRQLNALRRMPKRFQQWYGDQVTLKSELGSGLFAIKEFDSDVFNRTVRSEFGFDEVLKSSARTCLVHFKGPRSKVLMPHAWKVVSTISPSYSHD